MTPNSERLSGVVAVVTGGSRGLGAAAHYLHLDVSPQAGLQVLAGYSAYGASKWGLRGSDASSYMTGAELTVDGGASAGRIPIVSP